MGVISKGLRGQSPLTKTTDHFGGLILPKYSCIGFVFQSLLTLLPKCFALP